MYLYSTNCFKRKHIATREVHVSSYPEKKMICGIYTVDDYGNISLPSVGISIL